MVVKLPLVTSGDAVSKGHPAAALVGSDLCSDAVLCCAVVGAELGIEAPPVHEKLPW